MGYDRKRPAAVSLGFAAILLAGCATHEWAPGPDAKGTSEEAKAQCSLLARHSGGGFYAQGSARFVAGAALGAAVGDAIRANADFNDCMAASGWVVADKDASGGAQAQAAKDQLAQIRNRLNTCLEAVRRNPKYAVLLPHLSDTAASHYSLTQMSDSRVPTVQEAAVLASYGDEADACRDQLLAEVSTIDPRVVPVMQRVRARVRELDLALINRQITWGEHARRAQAVMDNATAHPGAAASADAYTDPADATNPPNETAQALLRYDTWQHDGRRSEQ